MLLRKVACALAFAMAAVLTSAEPAFALYLQEVTVAQIEKTKKGRGWIHLDEGVLLVPDKVVKSGKRRIIYAHFIQGGSQRAFELCVFSKKYASFSYQNPESSMSPERYKPPLVAVLRRRVGAKQLKSYPWSYVKGVLLKDGGSSNFGSIRIDTKKGNKLKFYFYNFVR